MQQHFQAIVTVLSLVNPLICGAMFAQIEAGQTSATRDSTKAALTVLVILVIAAGMTDLSDEALGLGTSNVRFGSSSRH
jgi:hypothetical protein